MNLIPLSLLVLPIAAICCYAEQPPTLTPAEQLAQKGISPDQYNETLACVEPSGKSSLERIRLLLAAGADVNHIHTYPDGYTSTPLTSAARYPDAEAIRLLLEVGADPNLKAGDISPLLKAIEFYSTTKSEQSLAIIRLLLEAGADVNAPDAEGNTPYNRAVYRPDILALLHRAGADTTICNNEGLPPLHRFLAGPGWQKAKSADFRKLLATGCDINVRDCAGNTLLHSAELVRATGLSLTELIAAGADINAANHEGATPLMIHARYDQSEIFVQLLEAGADINRRDSNGKTALDYAKDKFCRYNYAQLSMSAAGRPELGHATGMLHTLANEYRYSSNPAKQRILLAQIGGLLATGADPNVPDCLGTPYLIHTLYCNMSGGQALEDALAHGGNVHLRDEYGNTPLHHASGSATELLLAAGADPNARNADGAPVITHVITEIMWLSPSDWQTGINRAAVTVRRLLKAGADPNAADAKGNTALHYFLQGDDCEDIVRELIAAGTDINARNNEGATPLMLGAAQGWSDTLQFFLENHRPDLNARDKRGLTAMHYTAERSGSSPTPLAEVGATIGNAPEEAVLLNNKAEVERYLTNGGDVNVACAHGSTLLHWAAACGHTEIADMLLKAGANPNAPDNSGTPPLQLCFRHLYGCYYDIHEECAGLLLEAGANPNIKNRDDDELLIFAAARHATVLEQMLQKGISPDVRDTEGTPLLFHATSWKYATADSLKVLLAAGVDIFAKNPEGQDVFESDCVQVYDVFTLLDEERRRRKPDNR